MNAGKAPAPAARRLLRLLASAAGAAVLAAGGYLAWDAFAGGQPTPVPPCSWPLRARGHATSEQAGLVRCYLRALAYHDASALQTLADTTAGPVRITPADFGHTADARAGTASATFSSPQEDDVVAVQIIFADHATTTIRMAPEATTGASEPWRLEIGSVKQRTGGPPPAKP